MQQRSAAAGCWSGKCKWNGWVNGVRLRVSMPCSCIPTFCPGLAGVPLGIILMELITIRRQLNTCEWQIAWDLPWDLPNCSPLRPPNCATAAPRAPHVWKGPLFPIPLWHLLSMHLPTRPLPCLHMHHSPNPDSLPPPSANPFNINRRLGYNQLTGGLPAGFAANGSFTQLRVLSFAGNSGLGGTLPPEFGDAATALPLLQTLDVSGCGLTGTLPTQWGPGLQSLQSM